MQEEDIEKTITDVQSENCAGWGWTVVEKVVMATAWSRQCLVDSWSLPINVCKPSPAQGNLHTRCNSVSVSAPCVLPYDWSLWHKAGLVHGVPAQLLAQHNHHQDQAPAN